MTTIPTVSPAQARPKHVYLLVPGTDAVVTYHLDATGRLERLTCAGRTYLHRERGECIYGDGWVRVREAALERLILRRVETLGECWLEAYRWDEERRLVLVDGVAIERDERGRVTSCRSSDTAWEYDYDAVGLRCIRGPFGERRIESGENGRPVRVSEGARSYALSYDADGRRTGEPDPPANWNRDSFGRLWTVTAPDGRILATYLWDGFACLGRIDGPPGEPLAAVFSLDPSLTPVRVITRSGYTRIPRDAYGEALLAYPGVPGLFGGAHHEGRVHYMTRRLDPRVGAFDAPDPLHGGPEDLRRSNGYRGPLPVDPPEYGAYAVCRHDPVGRTDPTGAISWAAGAFSTLSSLTWSSQHVLASTLAVELLNFLLALFRGELGRWADKEVVSSRWLGEWGFRFDPVGLETININVGRAWTYYRYVWARSEDFNALSSFRVFVPEGPFRPTLYGTLLHAVPTDEGDNRFTPFVLRGSGIEDPRIPARAPGWTRAGGAAEPVIPGSRTPHFPSGGLHFIPINNHGPKQGRIIEVEPTGVLAAGRMEDREVLIIDRTGLTMVTSGTELFIIGASRTIRKVTVDTAISIEGKTRIRMTENPAGLARTNLLVRGVGAAQSSETLSMGTQNDRLNVAEGASTHRYFPQDPIVFSQGGTEVGAALVDRLEARLEVNAVLDAGTGKPPLRVEVLDASPGSGGTVSVVDPGTLNFGTGTAPDAGTALLINGTAAVLVTEVLGGGERRIAPALDASITGDVPWLTMRRARTLGAWDGQGGTTQLTYTPEESGRAPNTGYIGIRDDEGRLRQVRAVSARIYDELIIAAGPLPGNTGTPYTVERRAFADPNESGAQMETVTALVLDENPAPDWNPGGGARRPVLQLNPLGAATLNAAAGPTVISGATLSGTTLTATPVAGRTPTPAQMVLLQDPSGSVSDPAAVLVRDVRLTATLDRDITVGTSDLEVVPLEVGSSSYQAEALAADWLRLLPVAYEVNAAGNVVSSGGSPITHPVHMPRFEAGELVEVLWTDGGGNTVRHAFRVGERQGTTLRLEAGPPGVDVSTAASELRVRLLVPSDPDTGSSRLGREGAISAGNPRELTLKVWAPNALSAIQSRQTPIAIVKGRHGQADAAAMPALVSAVTSMAVELYSVPATLSGTSTVDVRLPILSGNPRYESDYTLEGKDVLFANGNPFTSHTDPVYAILFSPAPGDERQASGTFSGGNVMIPQDASESWELSRYESLETHELYHTRHISILGPLLLSPLPKVIWELPLLLSDSNPELPPFSSYVPATIIQQGGNLVLEIPDFHGIGFDKGSRVEVSQNAGSVSLTLSTREDNRFIIQPSPQLRPGKAYVRLDRRSDEVANFFKDLGVGLADVDTLGGLMSTVVGPILAFIPWLIALVVHHSQGGSGTRWWLTFHPARVPDPAQPARIQVDKDKFSAQVHDIVEIRVRGVSVDNAVTAVHPNGIIELRDVPDHEGEDRTLQIARVASNDPLNFASTAALNHMGFGWMRWLFDPYGQLQFRTDPNMDQTEGVVWDVFRRIMRWGFSSTSWTLFPFGFFFFDNLLKQGTGNGHMSIMEQSASEESGDLYSPLGRFRDIPEYVGDIGRYWYWPNSRNETLIDVGGSKQDAPGVHTRDLLRIIPALDKSGTGSAEPNQGAQIDAGVTDAALHLPDLLYIKGIQNPFTHTGTGPDSFQVSGTGIIPFSPFLERTLGTYVAFCRPSEYRATVVNGISGGAEGRQMTEEGDATLGIFSVRQPLYFDRTGDKGVRDVMVRVGGKTVANGDTVDAILCQRLRISVEPNGTRRYSATVLQPGDGPVIRLRGDLELQAQTTAGEEPVEITRDHLVAPYGIKENTARAWPQVHLRETLQIPVRAFSVRVTDTVPVRTVADPTAPPVAGPLKPGAEVFLLVPARMQGLPRQQQTYAAATTPAPSRHPQPDIDVDATATTAHAEYLADGGALRLAFSADDPPEEAVDLTWEIDVRASQPTGAGTTETISGTVRATLRLEPHFRLNLPSGTGPFQVTRGNTLTLVCDAGHSPVADEVVVTPSDDITVAVSGAEIRLDVAASAALGVRRVAVRSQTGTNVWAARSFEVI